MMRTVLVLMAMAAWVKAALKVQSNDKLFDKLAHKGEDSEIIQYSLAHFGVLPYGATQIGYVHYDPQNEYGCKKTRLEPYSQDDLQPILLVKRGQCEFIDKARNAQFMGAALLLIANDKEEDISKIYAIALHDGARAKIPTLIIGKADGEAMAEVLMDADKQTAQTVVVQFTMDIPKSNDVSITVVLGVMDRLGYNFLGSFKEMAADLDGKRFKIGYLHYFDTCDKCLPELVAKSCLDSEGKYCLFTSDNGKEAMKTLLWQKCALNQQEFRSNFMAFAERYSEDCLSRPLSGKDLYECNVRIGKAFVPTHVSRVDTCVSESLLSPYNLFEEDGKTMRDAKIKEFPMVIVNNQTIDGSLTSDNIFQAICFAFVSPPPVCSFIRGKYMYSKSMYQYVKNTRSTERNFMLFNMIVAVCVFSIAGFLFYYIFKRTYRRMISTRIDGMIKDSISKYKRVGGDTDIDV